eukprot:TRINITY_DN5681_c0_g1_i1.p1 TRINITY_DN5681_c0_g1~~TRINITY_DN5681_c0_g1_i1.p1  ORF type:complete len:992 (+),score=342.26 TRINITY_DN5681_c0_g1_i1:104-3079(+)
MDKWKSLKKNVLGNNRAMKKLLGGDMNPKDRRSSFVVDDDGDGSPPMPAIPFPPKLQEASGGEFVLGQFDSTSPAKHHDHRKNVINDEDPNNRRCSAVSSVGVGSVVSQASHASRRVPRNRGGAGGLGLRAPGGERKRSMMGPIGIIDDNVSKGAGVQMSLSQRRQAERANRHNKQRLPDYPEADDPTGTIATLIAMQQRMDEHMQQQHSEVMKSIRYLHSAHRQLDARLQGLQGSGAVRAGKGEDPMPAVPAPPPPPQEHAPLPHHPVPDVPPLDITSTPYTNSTTGQGDDRRDSTSEPNSLTDLAADPAAGKPCNHTSPAEAVPLLSLQPPGISLNDGDMPMASPFGSQDHRQSGAAPMSLMSHPLDDNGSTLSDSSASRPPPAYILEEDGGLPVLLPDSAFRIVWDMVHLVFTLLEYAIWSLAVFTIHDGDFTIEQTQAIYAIRGFITLFFCFDLYVQMHTCKLSGFNIIEDPKALRQQYIKSYRFPLDLLTTVPIDLFAAIANPKWGLHLMVIRTLRVFRMPELFRRSTPSRSMPSYVEFAIVAFWFCFVTHTAACIWIASATMAELGRTVPVHAAPLSAYQDGIYFVITSLTSVGFGDITAEHHGTRTFSTLLNLTGAGFMVVAGGRVGAMFIITDPYQLVLVERKRRLEYLMERNSVPWSTQREAFKVYPVILEASVRDYASIMEELPDFIQERISFHMKKVMLAKVPMFKRLSHRTACLLSWKLRDDFAQSREYLIKAGEEGKEMYFLSSGVVEVLIPDANGEEQWATNLTEGAWFGEIALLKKTKRIASIRCVTRCIVYRLEKDDFEEVCRASVELRELMEDEISRRVGGVKKRAPSSASGLSKSPASDPAGGHDAGGSPRPRTESTEHTASPLHSPHRHPAHPPSPGRVHPHTFPDDGKEDTPSEFMMHLENTQLAEEAVQEASGGASDPDPGLKSKSASHRNLLGGPRSPSQRERSRSRLSNFVGSPRNGTVQHPTTGHLM